MSYENILLSLSYLDGGYVKCTYCSLLCIHFSNVHLYYNNLPVLGEICAINTRQFDGC